MQPLRFPVAVEIECRRIESRWASEQWRPYAVIPLDAQPGTERLAARRVATAPASTRWRFDALLTELHRTEGEGYWLNLTSPAPKAFVMWRVAEENAEPPIRPHLVTLSYNEAARLLDAGEQVEGVDLAPQLLAWMQPFVAAHYTPEPRRKVRRRDPLAADPDPAR